MAAFEIDPAERAHMLWESITAGDVITDKAAFLRVVEGGIRMAAAAEREACARVADEYAKRAWSAQYPSQEAAVAASNLAKAIRSRG